MDITFIEQHHGKLKINLNPNTTGHFFSSKLSHITFISIVIEYSNNVTSEVLDQSVDQVCHQE